MADIAGPSAEAPWKDPEIMYDKDETPAPTPWAEKGEAPVAMESEMFDKDGTVRVQQRQAKHEPKGCWYSFKKMVGGCWMTKEMEDTKYDRELYIRTTLRELIVYIIFLIVLCIVSFGMTSSTMYYYTKVMSELFLDEVADASGKSFRDMSLMDDFWAYVDEPLIKGLYWEKWYNHDPVEEDQKLFVFFENKLLGLPRIRQVKVRNDSCTVPDAFEREIKECFAPYSPNNEDKRPFGPQNGQAWVYRSAKQLDGSSYWGEVGTYGGGGFIQELATTQDGAQAQLLKLKNNKWITRGTRAIIIDFSVYNANINLFCIVKLILEFPPTGGVIPSWNFRTVKLIRYVTAFDYFVLACEGIFCAFILYYLIEEAIEIYRHRLSYFNSFWNVLDILVIILAVVCIGFSIYRSVMIDKKLQDILDRPEEFANFEFLSYAQQRYNDALAVMVFFAWVKIFKYISFNKTMNQLSSTLSRCAKDVGGFAVMFAIFFFAYAQLGYLIFGTQVKDFSTFYDAVFTLLRTILGDFDFNKLEQANRVLGPLFFISYVFFVFFVLLNMFLAIINDTYAEVKAELATQKNEFEISDYFKRAYYNMLRKMNVRKDKIVDIQGALASDSNGDKQVDFDEWREHLKQRGYSEAEVEEMFQKYDVDGDRVLGDDEMNRMRNEMGGNNAMDDTGSERPPSSHSRFADFDAPGGDVGGGGFGRGGLNRGDVSVEEFNVLNKRVDRMEQSIGTVVGKIDAVLTKLEGMEKVKLRHREKIAGLINDMNKSEKPDGEKLKDLGDGVKKELDRFETDADPDRPDE